MAKNTPARAKSPATQTPSKTAKLNTSVLVAVIALVAIEHDGVRYEKDEELRVSHKQAKELADVNAVKIVGEFETDDATDEESSDGDQTNTGGDAPQPTEQTPLGNEGATA